MARRHPILSLVLIAFTIIGLFSFARSFQASSTLADIKQFDVDASHSPNTQNYSPAEEKHHNEEARIAADAAEEKRMKEAAASENHKEGNKVVSTEEPRRVADLAAGKPIMSKMPNMTIRAEVGRAGWKLLHTILSQYPETPTDEERETLSTYLKLFSRVYPCRECAEHFQELLRDHPPQLRSRQNAVMWGCQAHNVVNKRLGKKEFDCTYIFEEYDCGCGDTEDETAPGTQTKSSKDSTEKHIEKTKIVSLEKGG